jgi:hypothetical protein
MAKQRQQLPGESLTDQQRAILVQLGKMMGPQIDAFDEEVFLATLSERLKINHHSFARSGRVGVGRALPRV